MVKVIVLILLDGFKYLNEMLVLHLFFNVTPPEVQPIFKIDLLIGILCQLQEPVVLRRGGDGIHDLAFPI